MARRVFLRPFVMALAPHESARTALQAGAQVRMVLQELRQPRMILHEFLVAHEAGIRAQGIGDIAVPVKEAIEIGYFAGWDRAGAFAPFEMIAFIHELPRMLAQLFAHPRMIPHEVCEVAMMLDEFAVVDQRRIRLQLAGEHRMLIEVGVEGGNLLAGDIGIDRWSCECGGGYCAADYRRKGGSCDAVFHIPSSRQASSAPNRSSEMCATLTVGNPFAYLGICPAGAANPTAKTVNPLRFRVSPSGWFRAAGTLTLSRAGEVHPVKYMELGVAAASLAMLLTVGAAGAHDMAGMDMGAAQPQAVDANNAASLDRMMSSEHMEQDPMMAAHMGYTPLWPKSEADQKRANELVATLQNALAKYKDYQAAEADGYKPWHPEMKQPIVHFTRMWYGVKAAFTFNPAEPTSLLYKRTADGGYELAGAMYTAPKRASYEQLNRRVPLSVARWHKHINLCVPKKGADPATIDWTKFGMGSIVTKEQCDAAGGVFYPQLFGWMVHVYPWQKSPELVWAH